MFSALDWPSMERSALKWAKSPHSVDSAAASECASSEDALEAYFPIMSQKERIFAKAAALSP